MSIRCFVAVECGGDELAAKFIEVRRVLEAARADIKFVEPENVHLTMKFLGEIEQSLVEQVSKVVEVTSFQPFTARIERVGVFPFAGRLSGDLGPSFSGTGETLAAA